jgi:hypothetical protein
MAASSLFRTRKMFAALSRNAAADDGISSRSFAAASASLNAAWTACTSTCVKSVTMHASW